MNKLKILSSAKITVRRLILQYKEYTSLQDYIVTKENEKLAIISKISKQNHESISRVISDQERYPELSRISEEIDLHKTDLQQISDEMTFPNPVVWMMYKYKAYTGKSNEISTLRQFRNHCTPEGYICTKRYKFVHDYLLRNDKKDLNNCDEFPDELKLNKLYESDLIINLCKSLHFMSIWKRNEYLKTNGKVNKWETSIDTF